MQLTYVAVILKVDWLSSVHYLPKLFFRHFLSSSVNGDAYLFASNVIAEFFGVITGHYVIFNLRTRKRLAMEKQLYTRKFKMKLACHKKMCLNFPSFYIKLSFLVSIFLLKFKGEEERNLRHFYDCREGKLRGLISSKLFQEIQNVVVHVTATLRTVLYTVFAVFFLP